MALNKLQIKGEENKANEHYIETLVNTVHNNNFSIYYSKENSILKDKIDQLNLKFYLESEKYLSNKTSQVKSQDSLFIILFQQIGLYIEEIERLNALLFNRKDNATVIKDRIEESLNRQQEFETKELLIQTLKESNKKLEYQLCTLITNEDKLKLEIERLKRQNSFYKDKLKIYLLTKQNDTNNQYEESISKLNNDNEYYDSSISVLSKGINGCISNTNDTQCANTNAIATNPSVLNIKKFFVRKRNNSDQNTNNHNVNYNNKTTQQKKQSRIIKTVKENNEVKPNGTRWNSPLIGNKEDALRNYNHQLNNLFKMECFLKEMKQELFSSKENETQHGMNIGYFDSQDYSEINLKTEVISDIEDYEGGYYKNSTLANVNNKEIKLTKTIPKSNTKSNMNKANGQISAIGVNLHNWNNKRCKDKISYSNTNSKSKKTCKIISTSNGSTNTIFH